MRLDDGDLMSPCEAAEAVHEDAENLVLLAFVSTLTHRDVGARDRLRALGRRLTELGIR